ncbi:MAG: TetR/AcrR family transcriptional regulator [Actinomycetota bacterium]|nr:TetR/AcrR family transcriptional regulator [Actinomycetota bacterium]
MSFRKPGRPPEDKLARQREIYTAVAPLILEVGPRHLSIRDAARAAHTSVGGLYHYFPTKRDLVLHGLRWDARNRLCREYRERISNLYEWSPEGYVEAYLDLSIRMFAFIRPSVQAALELGAEELQEGLDSGLRANVGELVETLRLVVPGIPEPNLEALARVIRRAILGTLVDRHADLDETREQLRTLIEAYTKGERREQHTEPQAV